MLSIVPSAPSVTLRWAFSSVLGVTDSPGAGSSAARVCTLTLNGGTISAVENWLPSGSRMRSGRAISEGFTTTTASETSPSGSCATIEDSAICWRATGLPGQ